MVHPKYLKFPSKKKKGIGALYLIVPISLIHGPSYTLFL